MNFNLDAILADDSPLRPVCTITNTDKISCVSWSPLDRSHLVATDYSGAVTVWDSGTGQCIAKYTDHRKRAWAIDHSIPSPGLYASAAEDYSIKLWHSTQSSSTATIHTKAEACAVRFNRVMDNQLAFSCADHKAYYYDIRNVSTPLAEFHGHRKTVCGVCFVTREELITQYVVVVVVLVAPCSYYSCSRIGAHSLILTLVRYLFLYQGRSTRRSNCGTSTRPAHRCKPSSGTRTRCASRESILRTISLRAAARPTPSLRTPSRLEARLSHTHSTRPRSRRCVVALPASRHHSFGPRSLNITDSLACSVNVVGIQLVRVGRVLAKEQPDPTCWQQSRSGQDPRSRVTTPATPTTN